MEKNTLRARLVRYMDAGFPIIYINTFEEDKVDEIIRGIGAGRDIYEWNGTDGYIDFEDRHPMLEDCPFEAMLD